MSLTRVAALLVLGLLSACVTQVQSNVTTFHAFPDNEWKGRSIAVIPVEGVDPASLEWQAYRKVLEDRLLAANFTLSDMDNADFVAVFGYGIDNGREVTSTSSVPQYGVTGYTSSYTTGSAYRGYSGSTYYQGTTTYTPQYGVTGYSQVTSTDTVFARAVTIDIVDMRKDAQVWQMKLTSSGRCGSLAPLLPYFLDAAFKDFPGPNGDVRKIDLPSEKLKC